MYLTDQPRRVLANLSIPRSLPELARVIASDKDAPFDKSVPLADTANEIAGVLDELLAAGYVLRVGVVENAQAAVAAIAAESSAPELHPEKAEQYLDRYAPGAKDSWKLREGELYYFTAAGLDALLADR